MESPKKCYSYVGRNGGVQNINLAEGCWDKPIIKHEILHALGFFHEMTRFGLIKM